jgi:hypothetical protein
MNLTRPRLAFAGVVALVALTGCSGGGGGQSTADGGTAAADSVAAPSAREAAGALGNTGNAAGVHRAAAGSAQDVQQAAIIKNGEVEIRTPDPQRARDGVDGLLEQLRGSLDAEQTVYDKKGRIHDSHLVLRVPVASFTEAMRKVEGLGTVVHSSSTGKDVTTQVIDVQQRLKTLRISLHDLNSFQRQASDIGQLLRFENAITQRRGQYQSLKAQRNHLLDQTGMSTIDLDISVPTVVRTVTAVHHDHAGFVTGLRHGWSALTGTIVLALTAVGAALPFAVVLAALGLPLWWWTRRTSRHRPGTPAAADGPVE